MFKNLDSLNGAELRELLKTERQKFLRALDYNSSGSDLEEIRDKIKELETLLRSKEKNTRRHETDLDR